MTFRTWVLAPVLLLTSSPLSGQGFGAQVAVVGDEILVAEPLDQGAPAVIRRYARTGTTWTEVGTMAAPPPGAGADYFGRVILVEGETMVVSGTLYDGSTGAAWTYRRVGDGWQPDQMLQPDSLVGGEAFGRFGDLSGDLLFMSALGFRGVGAVWVFERDAQGRWSEQARLDPTNPLPDEFFGWDVAFDGERLIVGSLAGQSRSPGAAYVFSRGPGGEWSQEARLALPEAQSSVGDAGGGNGPGTLSVGWYQGMALLGLPGRESGEGVVLAFRRQPVTGEWVRQLSLAAFDRQPAASFGGGIHTHEGELWVSAPGEGVGGSIYRFTFDAATGSFRAASKISNTIDADVDDTFGSSVAASGDLAAVGQVFDDNGLGSVIVMRRQGGQWTSEAKLLIPAEPGLPSIVDRELDCGDDGLADQFTCSSVDLLSFLTVADVGGTRGTQMNDVWGWTDPETGREYAIVGRSDGTAFVDITNPVSPRFVGNLPKTRGSIADVWRDVKVYDNHAYVVADGAGRHGMQVFDLTRLRAVTGTDELFTPDATYEGIASAHNIVINEETGFAYAVGANGGGQTCGGGLHMIDIRTPDEPTFAGCFQHGGTGRAGTGYTHDAMCTIYRGPDLEHVGKEICFAANETALSIGDVTDKSRPIPISSATYPNVSYAHQGWLSEDHRYFFLDDELDEQGSQRGGGEPMQGTRTLIWDLQDLDDPVLAKEHFGEVFTTDHNLYIRGDLMYQSNYMSGLRILNVSDPLNPVEVGFFDTVPWEDSARMDGSWSNYPYFESGTIVVTSQQEGVFFVRYQPRELLP